MATIIKNGRLGPPQPSPVTPDSIPDLLGWWRSDVYVSGPPVDNWFDYIGVYLVHLMQRLQVMLVILLEDYLLKLLHIKNILLVIFLTYKQDLFFPLLIFQQQDLQVL